MKIKKPNQLHKLGQYDGFWVRRFNTMTITGNGAGLVLLANYMNKSGQTPLTTLQTNIYYFLPFLIGLLFSAYAVFSGMRAEANMLYLRYTLEEPYELGYADKLDMRQYKIDEEGKYFKIKRKFETQLFLAQLISAFSFVTGVIIIGFL